MTSPSTIVPKFLSRPNELGVVAVGFSGGQVKFRTLVEVATHLAILFHTG